ncbi:TetR/AcrR family transcriptional regulator [Humibacter soli]
MGRWEPDSSGRLGRAALDLYSERGYEQTTVHDIAERAGVTERTFFRYFADKREVLFDGSHALEETIVNAVASAPAEDSDQPLRLAVEALQAAAPFFDDRYDYARQRSAVIAANPSLQERELLKLSSMTVGIATALRARGVADTEADLAADVAVVVFHRGFQRWLGGEGRSLGPFMREVYEELVALVE